MKKPLAAVIFLVFWTSLCFGHGRAGAPENDIDGRKIQFPDTEDYLTIVLDPHTHSVFSDGHVWPRIRIEEALRDGLDAIAITEHLEYQPHLADIPHPDRNRAYEDAASAAAETDLLVIRGSEITRQAPAGHMNAIFIEDANALIKAQTPEDPSNTRAYYEDAVKFPAQDAVKAANDQGAFVFWNHPYWTPDFRNGIPVIPDFHRNNAEENLLHGIEIANGADYSEESFQIALDHDLTVMGVSDVHNLIDWDYEPHKGGHRPVTLVLAAERTEAAIKEALFDRRTVVWFRNMLAGRPEHLNPLLEASLHLDGAAYFAESDILLATLTNASDADFRLLNRTGLTFYRNADLIEVPAHESIQLGIKTGQRQDNIELTFEVLNALTAPKQPATITLSTKIDKEDVTSL